MRKRDYKIDADRIAAERGGLCLAETVPMITSRVMWKCANPEHPAWPTTFFNVRGSRRKKPSWCQRCVSAKRHHSIEHVRRTLDLMGIDLISTTYQSSHEKIHVRFRECGHENPAVVFAALQQGHGCPRCAPNATVSREEYQDYARLHGGRLIKMAERTTHRSVWWCGRHQRKFQRSFTNMKTTNTFCDLCSTSLGEQMCQAALEQLFRVPFEKKRFKDLRGVGGKPLEIDLYNDALKLGLEHHGAQHYQNKVFWGANRYDRQLEHDHRRRTYCREKGITLIEVQQLGEVTKLHRLKDKIKRDCLEGGIVLPADFDEIILDLSPLALKTQQEVIWKNLSNLAKKLKWTVVTPNYLGIVSEHEFCCDKGHLIKKTPVSLFDGERCPECYKQRRNVAVVLDDGRVFNSQTEAAKSLGRDASAVAVAAQKNGKCNGFRIARISLKQVSDLKANPDRARAIFQALPPPRGSKHYNGKPVALSDGRLFSTGAEAATVIGAAPETLYNAAKRKNGTCKGYGVAVITSGQEEMFRHNPDLLAEFWRNRLPPYPYRKPHSKVIMVSDGRIFGSAQEVAQALGVHDSSVNGAIARKHRCRGYALSVITSEQAEFFRKNPSALEQFCAELNLRLRRSRALKKLHRPVA